MEEEPITLDSVRRIDIKPGDTIVCTLALRGSEEYHAYVQQGLQAAFPGHHVVVLDKDVRLDVVGPKA